MKNNKLNKEQMFSDPVVGDDFFGRTDTLKILTKRVSGLKDGYRQNIAIVGPKLIGKSSLVLHFFSNFNPPKLLALYVDLRANSFKHFVYKFLGTVLYRYLKNINLAVEEELELLKQMAKNYIPKTVEVIQKIEDNMNSLQFDQAYETMLSLPTILKQECGVFTIVIFDEFHLLDTFKIKTPFSRLAKEIMVQKDTMYILISSQVSYARRILTNELTLLFGNFELIHLQPFDYLTCCNFLEKRMPQFTLPKILRDFLITFSEGYPFYLDILSSKIKEKAKELNQTELNYALISQSLNSLIFDSKGIINQYFTTLLSHNLNGADYSNFVPILLAAAERGLRLSDISKTTNRCFQTVAKQINCLIDNDLLAKVGVFFRIQDKIFRFWLKSVYQRKSLSLAQDPENESKKFCQEVEELIFNFSQEAKRDLNERIIELLKSFRNEMVMVQNKFFKFWHFDEVYPWNRQDLEDCIIARHKNRYWVLMVKKEKITEAQILKFIDCCRSSNYQIQRLIICCGEELDLNVKLIALEKRIWLWQLQDLNSILDLYGKQQIVL